MREEPERSGVTVAERDLPSAIGDFPILGRLGEGGSAVVYATEVDGVAAALKVPRSDRELSPKEQVRFLEEAKMLARVRHPAVVEVLDAGRLNDGTPFLLMRRYDGETLAERIAKRGALPLPHAIDLFDEIAAATTALHDAGLVHRDLKPENVFLVDDPGKSLTREGGRHARLLDFGIAKDLDAPASTTTQAGVARGTPATMAPERFFGAPATVSSDVYELAVLLYTMLVGRLPWPDVTNVDARLNPEPPSEAAGVPEALSTAILRALSTRPERRPATVRDLQRSVHAALELGAATAVRVTADTPVRASTPELEAAGLSTARRYVAADNASDAAQVIESTAHPSRPRSRVGMVIAGVALAGGLGIGFVVTNGLQGSAAERASAAAAPTTAEAPAVSPPAQPTLPVEPPPTAAAPHSAAPASTAAASPAARATTSAARALPAAPVSASAPPAPSGPPPQKGKPKGAPCTRSSECASMICAAETCQ